MYVSPPKKAVFELSAIKDVLLEAKCSFLSDASQSYCCISSLMCIGSEVLNDVLVAQEGEERGGGGDMQAIVLYYLRGGDMQAIVLYYLIKCPFLQ